MSLQVHAEAIDGQSAFYCKFLEEAPERCDEYEFRGLERSVWALGF